MEGQVDPVMLPKLQGLVRRWLARKRYKRLLSRKKHRDHVVKELLHTEETYIKGLTKMMEVYVRPLQALARGASDGRVAELNNITSKAEYIINLNTTLLSDLKERVDNWSNTQTIGDIFIKMSPFMKMYTQYTNNYESAVVMLEQSANDKDILYQFIQRCYGGRADVLTFDSYLIMPIQRIPRYNLLLEDMIAHTWEHHPDYESLCKALKMLQSVTDFVNKDIATSSALTKVLHIQNSLGGEVQLVAPHRYWITEGKLLSMRFGALNLFSSFVLVYLFNDLLVFSSRLLTSYRYKGHFLLHSTWVVDLPDTNAFKNIFQIKSVNSQTYTFCAASAEDKKTWIDALNKAFADMQPADKVKRKELQDAGEIPIEEGTREGSVDEKKNFALQMIIQAASEQQQQGKDQKHKRDEDEDTYGSLSGKEMARLVKMGVMAKQTEEEKNRSKFLNNAEVRKEYQFIQRNVQERQQMYLQAVSRSSGAISDQQLAEIEKRKEEVKQVTRAGSVRDSRNIFESGDSITLESPRQRTPGSTRMPSEAALLVARAQDDVAKNSPRGTPRGTPRGSDALDPPGRKMSAEIVKRVTSYNSAVGSADASPAASPASASRQDKPPKSPAAAAPPSSKEGADRGTIAKGTVGERVKAYQAHTAGEGQSEGQPLLTSRPEMEDGGCCTCVLS